jgi:hypothetical protein
MAYTLRYSIEFHFSKQVENSPGANPTTFEFTDKTPAL